MSSRSATRRASPASIAEQQPFLLSGRVVGLVVAVRAGAHEQADDVVPLLASAARPTPSCPPRRSSPAPPAPSLDLQFQYRGGIQAVAVRGYNTDCLARFRHVRRVARLPPLLEPHRADAAGAGATRRGAAAGVVQARVPQPERQHEGPHRAVHSGEGVAAGAAEVRRPRRRSVQRQHEHRAWRWRAPDGSAVPRGDARGRQQRARVHHPRLRRRCEVDADGSSAFAARSPRSNGWERTGRVPAATVRQPRTTRRPTGSAPPARCSTRSPAGGSMRSRRASAPAARWSGCSRGCARAAARVVPVLARPVNLDAHAGSGVLQLLAAHIPGVADSLSEIFRPERVPGLITVEVRDEDALATTRELIRLGFPVGPSSGLNYRAAVEARAARRPRGASGHRLPRPHGEVLHDRTVPPVSLIAYGSMLSLGL